VSQNDITNEAPTPSVKVTDVVIETPTITSEPSPTPTAKPPDVLFRYSSGIQMLEAGQYKEAIPQFDMVIRVLPKFAQAYNGRGLAHFHKDEIDLALEDFNTAIELKPNLADAYMNRVAIYLVKEQISEAVKDLEKALTIYEREGDIDKAEEVMGMLSVSERKN
jgi:tetratricopeptide (TPR) repeat protein